VEHTLVDVLPALASTPRKGNGQCVCARECLIGKMPGKRSRWHGPVPFGIRSKYFESKRVANVRAAAA
jgi:hypothetical protein